MQPAAADAEQNCAQLAAAHDQDLVAAIRAGDPLAMQELVATYRLGLLTYARCRLIEQSYAEDVVQEAFLATHKKIRGSTPIVDLPGLLYAQVYYKAGEQNRRTRSRLEHEGPAVSQVTREGDRSPDVAHAHRDSAGPAERAVHWDAEDCAALLASLTQQDRSIVALRFLEGYTFQEIATELDMPLSSVFRRCQQALSQLRRRLADGDAS